MISFDYHFLFKRAIKYKEVGNLYGVRNWVEYGLKQSKNELEWADFRVTEYKKIEKWWELVMSAYLMVRERLKRVTGSVVRLRQSS